MPKTDPKKWAIAAQRLAEGVSQTDTARELGVNPRTIRRWAEADDFKAQVAVLKSKIHPVLQQQEQAELEQWAADAIAHIEDMRQASRLTRRGGMNSTIKALRRLQDLPDEALRPADAIALLKVGSELILHSFELEARALGIYDLAEQMKAQSRKDVSS